MTYGSQYGIHRVIEPKGVLPQPAWKIDNIMELHDDEALIAVKTISINSSSFRQICTQCENDIEKIKETILKIVDLRGKLHNPITDTGGVLLGEVKKIGSKYKNLYNIEEGKDVILLTSLSFVPIKIYKITHIDMNSAQIEVEGECILFSSNPVYTVSDNMDEKYLMTILDEAGSCIQSWKIVNRGDKVLIMGAYGKIGLLCAFGVRHKIGNKGKIIGVVYSKKSKEILKKYKIFDEVYICDATHPIESFEKLGIDDEENLFDLVINCINTFNTESLSILCTKNKGTLYFASLTANYNSACLTAEGLGRSMNIIPYKGYAEGHSQFALKLFKKYKDFQELIKNWLKKDVNNSIEKEEKYLNKKDELILKGMNLEEYVFVSEKIRKVLKSAMKVAAYECSVLITGESGAGKEIIARTVYKGSKRNQGPYIKINCGSIPENLIESELFGYEEGAFTGARSKGKKGFFEIANKGTLFLDELGELPLTQQAKLLRAIQEKVIYRVGGTEPIKVDVRIVAATNRDLNEMVRKGLFREDLYYRLNVFPIEIPPLRQRKDDIIPLVEFFVEKYNKKFELGKTIAPAALQYMLEYTWPGNIREMENLVQRILINSENNRITVIDVLNNMDKEDDEYILNNFNLNEAVEKTEYNLLKKVKNKHKTTREMAKVLGISQPTVVRKLKKYEL